MDFEIPLALSYGLPLKNTTTKHGRQVQKYHRLMKRRKNVWSSHDLICWLSRALIMNMNCKLAV